MTAKELAHFKSLLEARLAELQTDSAKLSPKETASALSDLNDQATRESERGFDMKLKDRQRGLLRDLNVALGKVSEGTYGICDSCGDDIDLKRLHVSLTASFCISCQTEIEEGRISEDSIASPSQVA